MLSVECTTCNRNVPLYKLEKHHEDHINNKEKEDREFTEMVNNIEVIRVKRRVPAEKEKKQVADIQRRQPVEEVKGSEKVFALPPKLKEASKATVQKCF